MKKSSNKLSSAQLAELDDTVTSLIVDPWLGFTTRKMSVLKTSDFTRGDSRGKSKLRDTVESFVQDQNPEKTYGKLCSGTPFLWGRKMKYKSVDGTETLVRRTYEEETLLKEYIFVYLKALAESSGFKMVECNRYTRENFKGVKVVATKFWSKGETIKDLICWIAELSEEDEKYMIRPDVNDFSILISCRSKRPQLYLGPGSFVNHDCQPNCEFVATEGKTKVSIRVVRDIEEGDELLCYYGRHYFGTDNEYCECETCQSRSKGAFSSHGSLTTSPKISKYELRSTPDRKKLKRLQLDEERTPEKKQIETNFKRANITVEHVLSRPAAVRLKRIKIFRMKIILIRTVHG